MGKNRIFKTAFALLAGLVICGPANAYLYDFTQGNNSETVNGVTASIYAIDPITFDFTTDPLTHTAFDGDSGLPPCTGLLECTTDGIGINDDEVSYQGYETLYASFSEAVDITGIYLFDLFGIGDDGAGNPAEVAQILFGTATGFIQYSLTGTAAPGTQSGYAFLDVLVEDVFDITFFADVIDFSYPTVSGTFTPSPPNSDFALAAIETRTLEVPEPKTLTLLGLGLIGIGLMRMRSTT